MNLIKWWIMHLNAGLPGMIPPSVIWHYLKMRLEYAKEALWMPLGIIFKIIKKNLPQF